MRNKKGDKTERIIMYKQILGYKYEQTTIKRSDRMLE